MGRLRTTIRHLPATLQRSGKRTWVKLVRWAQGLSLRRRILYALTAGVILLAAVIPTVQYLLVSQRYTLDDSTLSLVGKANPNLAAKLTYDQENSQWQFNKDVVTSTQTSKKAVDPAKDIPAALKAQIGGGGKNDKSLYAVNFPTNPKKGVTVYDAGTQLSFTMTPRFKLHGGQATKDGRLVYPMGGGAQLIYTPKNNGMKEDIIVPKFIGKELSYSYKLDLPNTLTARIQTDGSVGIFSVDPLLLGNIGTSSNMDAEKLKSARQHAEKNHLLFAIPAPVIAQSGDKKTNATARFGLAGNTLTVTARNMDTVQYPISVDPSVVVTSSSDFGSGNGDNISYDTDQISRAKLTGGALESSLTNTTALATGRASMGMTSYNNYMYVIGGDTGSTEASALYAPINSNGTVGNWTSTTSLPQARDYTKAVAYNGYMYVLGGANFSTGTLYDTAYVAPINSNGTLGSWTTTTTLSHVRAGSGVVAYNGFMYIVGGLYDGVTDANSTATVQYAPIKADGTLGSWTPTTALSGSARHNFSTAVYNGRIYALGGIDTGGSTMTAVISAPITDDGSLGSWSTETSLPSGCSLGINGAVVHRGYVYITGGWCGAHSATVQYAPINANGSVGVWAVTTNLQSARIVGGLVAQGNYLFVAGGSNDSGLLADVRSVAIQPAGTTASFGTVANNFTTARALVCSVAYNGYLYAIGGSTSDNERNNVTTVQYTSINSTTGNVGTWNSTTVLPERRGSAGCTAHNGYVYVIGGYTGTTVSSLLATVRYAPINSNGTLGAWVTTAPSVPQGVGRPGVFTYATSSGTYLYSIGGETRNSYYALIGSSGSIGAWTTSANQIINAGYKYQAFAQVGKYIYAMGGWNTPTAQVGASVEYTSITSSGNISSWTATTSLNTAIGYSNGTAVNGCIYAVGGENAAMDSLANVQYACPNSDGTVSAWYNAPNLTAATTDMGVTSYNGYIYGVGGYRTAVTSTTQFASVNNGGSGTVGSWATDSTGTYATARSEAQTLTYNNYLYVLGGRDSSNNNLNDVQYARLNDGGTVGSWAATSSFATARQTFSAAAMNGYMYLLGGYNGVSTHYKDIQYAKINSDGSLGTWASAGSNVSNGGAGSCMVAANGYIYSIGGYGGGGTIYDTVQYAVQNSNGTVGSWQSANNFSGARSDANCTANGTYIYLSGGEGSSSVYDSVQYATINSNGSLSTWAHTTSFYTPRVDHAMFTYNGFVYIAGGYLDTSHAVTYSDVQYAPLHADGTIGRWQHTSSFPSFGYSDMATANGYVYSPRNAIDSTDTHYAPLTSIARKGSYNKLIDLNVAEGKITSFSYGGTLPGGNNAIKYRAAGQNGVYGATSSTTAPGTATQCQGAYGNARYIWLSASLDDTTSATFGASYQSTLTDITVNYTPVHPDPQQRLRGGKTLVDGTLSPLDTCPV